MLPHFFQGDFQLQKPYKRLAAIPRMLQIYLDKKRNPLTFRDQCYTSKYTGITSARPKIPYMKIQDDSKETYMESGRVDEMAAGKNTTDAIFALGLQGMPGRKISIGLS